MTRVRIVVVKEGGIGGDSTLISEQTVEIESAKRLTSSRAARVLAQHIPGFRRRKGRYARFDGVEIFPVMEKSQYGWYVWRLATGSDQPSGFEPPISGRVGKVNSKENPYANISKGIWERAEVSEAKEMSEESTK